MDKLPRVVIIENVRGFAFKRNAALLAHLKDCLQATHYSVHIRILCTSQSAVPQGRGRCYVVGIRGQKVCFKWPKVVPMVGLKHFSDRTLMEKKHALNRRQKELLSKLQETHKGRLEKAWYCFDAGATLKFVSCLKGKCPCLTHSRPGGPYLPRLRRFLTLREHGALQGLPRCHLVHAGGMQWRRTGGASSVGRCHELACLDEALGKRFSSVQAC